MQLILVFVPTLRIAFCLRCSEWPEGEFYNVQRHGATCYWAGKRVTTWDIALRYCSHYGGKLIQPDTREKSQFVKFNLTRNLPCMWIGLSDLADEGNWRWTDGSKMTYNEFTAYVVDRLLDWMTDCAVICGHKLNEKGSWEKYVCSERLPYACESDALPDVSTTETIGMTFSQTAGTPTVTHPLKQRNFGKLKLAAQLTVE